MPVIQTPIGPCDWGVTWDQVAAGCSPCGQITSQAERDLIIRAGVAFAWAATGRRFGVCEVTWRPCLWCSCPEPGARQCGCWWYQKIDLNPGQDRGTEDQPVQGVSEVRIDGEPLDATGYRLQFNRYLLRVPQGTRWPACQDEGADVAPLQVTWTRGTPPDDDLLLNGVVPFCRELSKGFCGDDCSIDPSIVTAVQREGVSFALINPGDGWKDGLVGMPGVNAAIKRAWPPGLVVSVVGGMTDPLQLVRHPFSRVDQTT